MSASNPWGHIEAQGNLDRYNASALVIQPSSAMAASKLVQHTAVAVALTFMLAALPLAFAVPPNVNLVWTDDPPTPYAPVTLVPGQSLVLNWPGAVRRKATLHMFLTEMCPTAGRTNIHPLTQVLRLCRRIQCGG